MGLDTSHDCWHGAYSAFSRWRDTLARAAGYRIIKSAEDGYDTILIDWGHVTEAQLYGHWEKTPEDPLIVLIAHSDCDGQIFPAQALPLADRLEELLPKLKELDEASGHIAMRGGWIGVTEKFIAGLRAAAAANEAVDFH